MAFLLAVPQAVGSYTSGVPVPQVSPQGLCGEHRTVPDVGILDDSGPRDIGVRKYPQSSSFDQVVTGSCCAGQRVGSRLKALSLDPLGPPA